MPFEIEPYERITITDTYSLRNIKERNINSKKYKKIQKRKKSKKNYKIIKTAEKKLSDYKNKHRL